MASEFMRTYIAKMPGDGDWSWEDELWVVRGDWDDLRAGLVDTHGWVARLNADHPEYGGSAALPPGQPITFVLGYPPPGLIRTDPSRPLRAVAKTISDVVDLSLVRDPSPETAAKPAEFYTQNNLTITLVENLETAFAHFPVSPDRSQLADILVAVARDPQVLIEAIRGSNTVWRTTAGDRRPEDLAGQPASVRIADIDEASLTNLRMVFQTVCTQAANPVAGPGPVPAPVCCQATFAMVPSERDPGETDLVVTGFWCVRYFLSEPDGPEPGDAGPVESP